ncbi:class I SAM-dependent methyltransferase [Actinomadura graeca]|uniref:Class I SAM-dependent methyltransferase n=1 Tax=Actinomadura graeca TaxID=2750812 RepID=A0ABX8QY84_9ACTN|nr:class I SAM-dependent methyltransferase [Actinomadura graeca]QXJ23134.1 class I SAM-dependent methyltransferase [Actinomadura graeca]
MDIRERWKTDRLPAAIYDFAVQNGPISRVAARLIWGYDIRHLRRSIEALDPDALTLDIPSGGGLAIRDNPRHVAADLSRTMLDRARGRGAALVQADIDHLPFPTGTFDLCVTYNGLHCLPDPENAVRELTRVLRPGGTLRGTTVVRGAGRDRLITMLQGHSFFGPGGTTADLRGWLTSSGLTDIRLTPSGAVTGFTALKPANIEDAPPPSIR